MGVCVGGVYNPPLCFRIKFSVEMAKYTIEFWYGKITSSCKSPCLYFRFLSHSVSFLHLFDQSSGSPSKIMVNKTITSLERHKISLWLHECCMLRIMFWKLEEKKRKTLTWFQLVLGAFCADRQFYLGSFIISLVLLIYWPIYLKYVWGVIKHNVWHNTIFSRKQNAITLSTINTLLSSVCWRMQQ